MKKIFSLLVFCMCLLPIGMFAEKIKYGNFITYDGKVNASKIPEGKGKLITEYKVERMTVNGRSDEVNKDILQGIFSQGKVEEAKLQLARYNGPLWLYTAMFKGTLEYEIQDNHSVKYTLLEGTFTSADHRDYTITRDNPLVFTRIPSYEGCEIKSEPLYYTYKGEGSLDNTRYKYFYQSIGEIKEVYQIQEYVLTQNFELEKGDTTAEPVYTDGTKVTIYNIDNFDIEYPNGDFLRQKDDVQVLRKTCPDGVLDYNSHNKEANIAYADGANYKGTVRLFYDHGINDAQGLVGIDSYSSERIINDVMKAPSLESMKICPVTGIMVKNGENIEYKNGLTMAEIEELNRKAEEERKAEEQRQAAAMKAKTDAAKNKNQAIKAICEKTYSYPNMKVNIDGFIMEGGSYPLKGIEKAVAVLKTYDFGAQGKTMALYVYIKDESTVLTCCFSTSGKNVKLIEHRENGVIVYGPNLNFPIALAKAIGNGKTAWSAHVRGGNMTSSLYEGMTEDEFLLEFKNSMMPLNLVESNGDTKVYQLIGAKMNKNYYWYGEDDYNYQLGSKETGRFYFKNDKLTKWFLDL